MKLAAPDYPSGKHGWMVVLVTALVIFSASLLIFYPSEEKITGGQVFTESFQITAGNNVNTANYSYAEEFPNDKAGTAMGFGDINGDGFKDMVIGAYGYPNGNGDGKVYFIYRPLINGSNSLSSANVSLTTSSSNESLGYALAVGNVNNDAYQDVLIGARWKDNTSGLANDSGGAYLFYGAANLASSLNANNSANVTFYGEKQGDMAGSAVAIGDINGDGFGDVIIGAPYYNSLPADDGKVCVFFGPFTNGANLSLSQANASFIGAVSPNAYLGTAIQVGDINNDLIDDIVIGALGLSQAYLIYGPIAQGTSGVISILANVTFNGTTNSWLGDTHTISIGEINNAGYKDILIGAPQDVEYGGTWSGRAFLIYMNSTISGSLDLNTTMPQFIPEAVNDYVGYSTAITDYNGDGYGDVLIGASGNDAGGNLAGKIYLFYGPFSNTAYNLSFANESWYGSLANEALGIVKAGTIVMSPTHEGLGTFKISLMGEEKALPAANFIGAPVTGDASLAVTFTDGSSGATSWAWDFQNDGIVDSTLQNPSFTYTTAGTYSVKLTVKNTYGISTKTILNYITVTTAAPPSDNGGGGGGGCVNLCPKIGIEQSPNPESKQVCQMVGSCRNWVTYTVEKEPEGVLELIIPGKLEIIFPAWYASYTIEPSWTTRFVPSTRGACQMESLPAEKIRQADPVQEGNLLADFEVNGNQIDIIWARKDGLKGEVEIGLENGKTTSWVQVIDYNVAGNFATGATITCPEEIFEPGTGVYVSDGTNKITEAVGGKYIAATVSYTNNKFEILNYEIKEGIRPANPVGHYVWAISDAEGEVLEHGLFGILDEIINCNGEITRKPVEGATTTLYLPYDENAVSFEVEDVLNGGESGDELEIDDKTATGTGKWDTTEAWEYDPVTGVGIPLGLTDDENYFKPGSDSGAVEEIDLSKAVCLCDHRRWVTATCKEPKVKPLKEGTKTVDGVTVTTVQNWPTKKLPTENDKMRNDQSLVGVFVICMAEKEFEFGPPCPDERKCDLDCSSERPIGMGKLLDICYSEAEKVCGENYGVIAPMEQEPDFYYGPSSGKNYDSGCYLPTE